MSWRERIAASVGPGGLCGVPLEDWLRLLWRERFAVDPPYWLRACAITWGAVPNSAFKWWERWRHEAAIRATTPQPPLFILGIWRSGTTHLHNLLARDTRFAFPSFYDVLYPQTFLTTEWFNAPFLNRVVPRKRPQDNMEMAMHMPQEDEFAISALTQMSFVMSWTFPRNRRWYDRFLTLRDCSREELARWQSALRWLMQKLTYKYRRPLILKSPGHTGRIRLLLEVFPDARFVHIHRNPYEVFQSSRHSALKVTPWWTLQRPQLDDLEERMLRQYAEVFDAFFAERGLILPDRWHELSYESLQADPVGAVQNIYAALRLPDFSVAEPAVRSYVDSVRSYQKNRFAEVEPPWKAEVARRCRRCFDEWGYDA
jgi:hypothetical protein